MAVDTVSFAKYFSGVTIGQDVQICGIKNVSIGVGSCIGSDALLNVFPNHDSLHIVIGKCVLVGRRSVLNTAGYLEIGDYSALSANVYIGDAEQNYDNVNVPLLVGGVTENRSIIIEENCFFAMNSVAVGNIVIGRGSVVEANTVVRSDVPPFSVVSGNPAVILKMYDPRENSWIPTPNNEIIDTILEHRKLTPPPSRAEYRKTLSASHFERVTPIVAGVRYEIQEKEPQ